MKTYMDHSFDVYYDDETTDTYHPVDSTLPPLGHKFELLPDDE